MLESFSIMALPGAQIEQRDMSIAQLVARMQLSGGDFPGSGSGGPSRVYSQVAAVYRCVMAKADAMGRLLLQVSSDGGQVIENGPLAALAEMPNPKSTGRLFWRDTSAYLDLFGACHWWIGRDLGGKPIEAWPVNPLQMRPVIDRDSGELVAWKYTAAGKLAGKEELIPAADVHSIIDPDFECPDRPYEGLGPRRVAARAISQVWKADRANESSLDNDLAPSGAFVSPDALTDGQKSDLRNMAGEGYAGVRNRRRFMVLSGGLDWKAFGNTFSEMEFPELKGMSITDVCVAFGVLPPVIGYFEDSNYAHAESAMSGFWVNTIMPRAEWLAEEWTAAMLAPYDGDQSLRVTGARRSAVPAEMRGYALYRSASTRAARLSRGYFAWFDGSGVPALQKAWLGVAEQIGKLVAVGVTLNDAVAMCGLPLKRYPWGDTWHKPIGLNDVREDTTPGKNDPDFAAPETPQGDGSDDEAEGRALGTPSDPAPQTGFKSIDDEMAALWKRWRASWAGMERAMLGKVRKHFHDLRVQTIKRFDAIADEFAPPEAPAPAPEGEGTKGIEQRVAPEGLIGRVLFDLTAAKGKLAATVGPIIRESARLGGEQSMQEAAAAKGKKPEDADPFNIKDPAIEEKMRRRVIKLTGADDTVRRKLSETMADGLANGESPAEIRERIKHTFDMADSRAETIARTEIGGAVEEARNVGRTQAGIPMKSWLWSLKKEGRVQHQATEAATRAKPIPNDQDFTIAGTTLTCAHPRDPSLPPEQSINCGCSTLARFAGDSIKTVIARYKAHGFLGDAGLRALDQVRQRKAAGTK